MTSTVTKDTINNEQQRVRENGVGYTSVSVYPKLTQIHIPVL